jgi:3-hydroxyisobutyrate dehydrogenase-like beta-hydroxyacid dehydrogenase
MKVIPRNFAPGFRMDLMAKDAGLALTLAQRLRTPQLVGSLVQELRVSAMNKGLAEQDATALVQFLEEMAGVELTD